MNTFPSLNDAYAAVLAAILDGGRSISPRGLHTREIAPFSFVLANPRHRCITNSARRWSFPLAIGEFCWHASGSKELTSIEYYAKRWRDYSNDGETIRGSCYGHRMFRGSATHPSQWNRIVDLLKRDPDSRRAVIDLFDATIDLDSDSKDVPCANLVQFLIREGKLLVFVSMRSNDAIWGLPYDVFLFTMFQELMAVELGLELGPYYHSATSMHLYERHFELARLIVDTEFGPSVEMQRMTADGQLSDFLLREASLRNDSKMTADHSALLDPYWESLLDVLRWHKKSREQGAPGFVIPESSPYRALIGT